MNDKEITKVANSLAKLEPGYLPTPIFDQVTRLITSAILEVVPLRFNKNDGVEILLLQRPVDDPVWPGALHTPGTVIRATDTSYEAVIERLLKNELGINDAAQPTFVKNILHHSGRGQESSLIYWLELTSTPQNGAFYPVDDLPKSLVKSQLDFIPDVIAYFVHSKKHM